ncbi:UNVERIFIED_CONTAM: BTB/POZ domain-containing protein [Sesamum calycinum]|uniref:BTB/POZ domain-containing protein n=1 Tax=Sesamum calycinum TaxID=2727403 RepID=A0AAW2QX10_9LAMI
MPPFAGSNGIHHDSSSNIVTIDVGGQLFQTTKQTLSLAGSKSFFSKIASSDHAIPFVDRDPELFSILLSLLRTGNLPSKAKAFDIQDLIFESQFYGIENLLLNSQSNPSQFDAFNLEKSFVLPLSGRDSPSAISTTPCGSLHVAHGSKVTSFDWSLQRKSTILTQFTAIDSLLALSPAVAAAGATDFSGLQILDLDKGYVKDTLNWENVTKSGSTVQAIGASPEHLFTSFESSSHSGPSGVSGNIKFWDIRSGNVVWELKEKVDCFSDVTVSNVLGTMFKVGVNTGEVFCADLRNMDADHPWVCLGDGRKVINGKKEGFGCKVESQGNQVFCSKGGNLELWSEILLGTVEKQETGLPERVFRKNLMGRAKDMGGNRITNVNFGGSKMFLTRKDQQCVEVWSSVRSF